MTVPPRFRPLLLWLLLLPAGVSAGVFRQQIRFTHLGVPDGLSQDIVTAICQDRDGFIWIGTEYGLNRYDGYSITVFRHEFGDSLSLPDNSVQALLCDRDGDLWIGTNNGVAVLRRRAPEFETIPLPSGSSPVYALAQDGAGVLWMASRRLFGYRKADRRWTALPSVAPGAGEAAPVRCLAVDRPGNLWAGSEAGLWILPPADTLLRPVDSGEGSAFNIRSLFTDTRGRMWAGAEDRGILVFPSGPRSQPRRVDQGRRSGLPQRAVFAFAEDRSGMIWAGTWEGISLIHPDSLSGRLLAADPDDPASLGTERIYSLLCDRSGGMWVGTWRGGLARHDPYRERFASFAVPPGEGSRAEQTVLAVHEDRDGTVWAGMNDGLRRLDPEADALVRVPGLPAPLRSVPVAAILEDRRGDLWAGTLGAGLFRRHGNGNWTRHVLRDAAGVDAGGTIRTLLLDTAGRIWVGTMSGIAVIDPAGDRTTVMKDNPADASDLSGEQIWCLTQTRDGTIWIGTWGVGAGLNSLDPRTGKFALYPAGVKTKRELMSGIVRAIAEDREGNLWLGTWGGGLTRFDRTARTFRTFTESDGLPNIFVKALVTDRKGDLWVSTEQGLSRFTPPDGPFRTFTQDDGVRGYFFMTGSACAGRDGILYFGSEQGLTVFDPSRIRNKEVPPPVLITGVKVFDQPVNGGWAAGEVLRLAYTQNFVSFEFSALDYTAPARNLYSYRMEGFDAHWTPPSTRRFVSYAHLPPGEYVFHVRAANADGIWNEAGAVVALVVDPPFWRTWWFIAAVVLLAASILSLLYRYRVRRLLAVERTRAHIAEDLHDEISGTLSGVRFFATAITNDAANRLSGPSARFLERIADSTASMQESLADIIWAVNPEHDTWDQLFARCRRYASDLFDARGISYTIETPPSPPRRPLGMEQRRNFWLLFKELTTNIVRHAECGRAVVRVLLEPDNILRLHVEDDGRGFDPDAVTDRNGIKNIRRRIAGLRGSVAVRSAPGKGTTWEATFTM